MGCFCATEHKSARDSDRPILPVSAAFETAGRFASSHTLRLRMVAVVGLAMLFGSLAATSFAQEKKADGSFRTLIRSEEIRTFQSVQKYLQSHPDADDVDDAREWLLDAAIRLSLEQDAATVATDVLTGKPANAELAATARQVKSVALIRNGKLDDAMAEFELALGSIRLRDPDPALQLATALVTEFQIAGDIAAAQKVYDKLSTAYFLNTTIRRLCAGRLQRLAMVGKQVPAATLNDLSGTAVSVKKGEVTLVDFWATNCLPCLGAFPELKRMYSRQHARGLAMLGVSLDSDDAPIRAFQKDAQLPWPLARDDARFTKAWGVATIPAMFLVDGSGKIVACDLQLNRLEAAIEGLLKTKK